MKDAGLIWQIAVVRRDEAGSDWLEFDDPGGCSKCSRGTGCGAALFSRLFARPDARVPMPDDKAIPAGRLVRVGLDPRWLLLAATTTYLLPVIGFVAGALVADRTLPANDAAALVSGIAFALLAALPARGPMKLIGRPGLVLVELNQGLESKGRHLERRGDSGHLSRQD